MCCRFRSRVKTAGSRLSLLDARVLTGLEGNGMLDPGKLPLLGIVQGSRSCASPFLPSLE
jgi:hypothetical protein